MSKLLADLRAAVGDPNADFRDGQQEAILACLMPPYRALVVQATGWGKSIVYFLATRLLRDHGRGPTLVVSPLLSLMRNQLPAARRIGIRAELYASNNTEDWERIGEAIAKDEVDLLLVSPERLANDGFSRLLRSTSLSKVGLIVIDEAHCISDWGHDFRPDYQRLGELIRRLPPTTSVLATTATANERVVDDIRQQLGGDLTVQRGPLARRSLQLQVIPGFSYAERLAWLDTYLSTIPGSGIIYALTVRDADQVASFLASRGHAVCAYHADIDNDSRVRREQQLLNNEVKALVATVALGMGFDKPDLGFVVHFQSPSNLVAYYQQIGRAGRALDQAIAVMMVGEEDDRIHEYFISHARPPLEHIEMVLDCLADSSNGRSWQELTRVLNLRHGEIERALKVLSVMPSSPIIRVDGRFQRTPNPYRHDFEREDQLARQRFRERERLVEFSQTTRCLMEMVREELDDPHAEPCGRCESCIGEPIIPLDLDEDSLEAAMEAVSGVTLKIEPRRQWPTGALESHGFRGNIKPELMNEPGVAIAVYGDPGVGAWVKEDKRTGRYRDELVDAALSTLRRKLGGVTFTAVCAIPTQRANNLVPDIARRIGTKLGVPYRSCVGRKRDAEPQKAQRNSAHQAANLDGVFVISEPVQGTILLVDDMVDSGWTLTIVGALLRQAGADAVVPFTLASTRGRETD